MFIPTILYLPNIGVFSWNDEDDCIKEGETKETYKNKTGHETALPIYYRNKIYNEEEREKLWIQKLDKEERWVGGSFSLTSSWTANAGQYAFYDRNKVQYA